jgi:hypothetical protein
MMTNSVKSISPSPLTCFKISYVGGQKELHGEVLSALRVEDHDLQESPVEVDLVTRGDLRLQLPDERGSPDHRLLFVAQQVVEVVVKQFFKIFPIHFEESQLFFCGIDLPL